MRCPTRGFDGAFNKARPRFLTFDLGDLLLERERAEHSSMCPNCGTTVTPAYVSGFATTACLLLAIIGMALGAATFFWHLHH